MGLCVPYNCTANFAFYRFNGQGDKAKAGMGMKDLY